MKIIIAILTIELIFASPQLVRKKSQNHRQRSTTSNTKDAGQKAN